MTPLVLACLALLVGVAPVAAQSLAETTIATSTAEELNMANQARSVTRSAITTVFGAGQNAPVAPAGAPPVAMPPPVANVPVQPAGEAWNAATAAAPDAAPVDGAVAVAAVDPRRDPFRPFTLNLRPDSDSGEVMSPLQRYELPQLRLAAVVLAARPPRAMLQDNSGMGFIVTPGTPIGRRHGVVKTIEPRRIVVEELVLDYYGRQQAHQVVIEMPKDDKSDKAQETP